MSNQISAKDQQEEILRFWFGDPTSSIEERASLWWKKDPSFDALIKERFGATLDRAARGELESWRSEPRSLVAYLLLLDQFSRNIHRGSPRAFEQDERALRATLEALNLGTDRALHPLERYFLYMPLMHAEDRVVQARSVEAFSELAEASDVAYRTLTEAAVDYAKRHRAVIDRFGRFPHRNAILGRASTQEETAFLLEPRSSF